MYEKPDILQITKQLLTALPKGIFVLYGKEEFLKRHFLLDIKKKLLTGDFLQLNYAEYSGPDESGHISDACCALPQFADDRLVVWYNSSFPSVQAKYKSKIDGVLSDVDGYPQTTLIIYLYDSELDTDDYQAMKKLSDYKLSSGSKLKATYVNFEHLSPAKLSKWIQRHFSSGGVSVSDEDNKYLAERCGRDMNMLSGQIDKLCAYAAVNERNTVTREDIDNIVPAVAVFDSFYVQNCVRKRDIGGLLDYINDSERKNESALIINAQISKEISNLYAAKCAKKSGISYSEFAKAYGMSEYPAKLCYSAVSDITEAYLSELVHLCFKSDIEMKRNAGNSFDILRKTVCSL